MTVKSIRRQTIVPTRGTSRQFQDERQSNAHSVEAVHEQQPVKVPPPPDMGQHVDKMV